MKNMTQVKILSVDDEKEILNSLRRIFVKTGYTFVTADSGAEGLAALRHATTFDVIISDYRMPAMNGIEFLTLAHEQQPESLRILLTGQAPDKDIAAALESGVVSRHITKPWNNGELVAVVENWIVEKAVRTKVEQSNDSHLEKSNAFY